MNRSNAHRLLVPSLLAAAVLLLAPSTALAAFNVYLELTLNGTTIEGESSVQSLDRDGKIECVSFSQAGFSDTTRTPPGQRSYRPVTLVKRVDKSTPLLFQAWAQAANQGEAIFRFYRADPNTGQEQHYYTITLQNPQIVAVSTSTPNTLDPVSGALPDLQVVSFVFESITYTDEATGTEYQDTPGGP